MDVSITAGGIDISKYIDWRSVDLVSVLTKEVSILKFNVKIAADNLGSKIIPALNDIIAMYDASGQIFGGTVTQSQMTIEGYLLTFQITCTDWSYLLDGTLVKKNYSLMDPHDIVVDLVNTFCAGKGFTTNHVQTGNFLVPSIKFNYQQPTKCLESLAKLIGWDWYIDPQQDIHFFLGNIEGAVGEGGLAPITIDGGSGQIEWNSLNIDQNIQNMKNSVFVIGGTYLKMFNATNTSDVYQSVAETVVYPIAYPYQKSTIMVTFDGVAQTVGIDQQTDPATVQVLYNDSSRFVKFTSDPGSGHTLKVFGNARIPIVAHASDPAAIALFGEFQDVIVDAKITTVPEAQARAQAEILQFGHSVFDITFKTLVPGCALGQVIFYNLLFPNNPPGTYPLVIKRIEATVFAPGDAALGVSGKLEYQIEAIGSDTVTFVDLMTMLLQKEAAQNPVDDSTVTEDLTVVDEEVTIAETLAVTTTSRPYHWGQVTPQIRWGAWTWL